MAQNMKNDEVTNSDSLVDTGESNPKVASNTNESKLNSLPFLIRLRSNLVCMLGKTVSTDCNIKSQTKPNQYSLYAKFLAIYYQIDLKFDKYAK